MKIFKPSNFLTLVAPTVAIFGLMSCLNDPPPDPSPTTTVNQTITTVDANYIGAYPSLTVAPDGRLHASYYTKLNWDVDGGGALRHAVLQNGSWTTEVVDGNVYDPTVDVGRFSNIAADAQGGLHVAYWDVTNKNLVYTTLTSGTGQSWQKKIVADMNEVYEGAALQLDASGKVYIGYCGAGQIWLAAQSDGSWISVPVAAIGADDVRAKVALQFDRSNTLHVAFFDPVTKEIKYTVGPAVGPFQAPETVTTLDSGETRMNLTLDGDGRPHVVFYDLTQNTLRHAYKSVTGWTEPVVPVAQIGDVTSTSDGSPTTGYLQLSSLVDLQGRLHVSYYQGTGADPAFGDQDLKHVVMRSSDWTVETIETIDDAGDVGRTSAMAEDAAGTVHIIYRDATNNDLKYAYLQ